MKKFKEFRTEQKYIVEVGPIAATIGAIVGGIALYKGGKSLWNKFTGWKESQKEKKANKKAFVIDIKRFNKETGELEDKKEVIRGKSLNNDEIEKFKKKMQKDADIKNASLEADFIDSGGPEKVKTQAAKDTADVPSDTPPEVGDDEQQPTDGQPEDDRERDKDGNLKNIEDAQKEFEKSKFKRAPDGWTKDPNDEKKVIKPEDIKKDEPADKKDDGWKKVGGGKMRKVYNSKVLKFGEFIAEDVMSDLKKITKSKNDSEISLDDGNDIPIDPLTAEILVKYIEGLGSSEKNKTIKQIQRTERAFMKVLGKAHGA